MQHTFLHLYDPRNILHFAKEFPAVSLPLLLVSPFVVLKQHSLMRPRQGQHPRQVRSKIVTI